QDFVKLLTNENYMSLIYPRRLCKTDLIRNCFNHPAIKEGYYTFMIDIYATGSLRDFVNVFGKAILEALKPRGRKVWELFVAALKSLQQELTFDMNGIPVWSLGMGNMENPAITLDEIFNYLDSADKPCLVAIDEFQQITQYPDGQNIEAALRTRIQRCQNATFVFAGSKRHLMGEIFTSPSRPFYQSVITMGLSPISEEKYTEFAVRLFEQHGKQLAEEVVHEVYSRFSGVTSCLQRVMNVLYFRTERGERCTLEGVDDTIDYLLDLYSENYETQLSQMSEKQRIVFRAIVAEGKAKNVTGGAFIKKYHLWSASSVMSALKALLDKDFVTQEDGAYIPYDQFFALWLQRMQG
ncbi:MAG: ATPase, partial [Bacteroidaceae bacterium]|nr:ATPase [Bacteroidaceae bacterium]